jgi:4-hydroxy-3-polyprenylbenzoate decarboxylase
MRLVVGISGASGAILGIRLLKLLKDKRVETHLILTRMAQEIIPEETRYSNSTVKKLASFAYEQEDMNAPMASGSFQTDGMVVIPCSIKTLSAIANSYNDNLLIRAADVTLKERRRLVLVVRETPLHKGHLQLLEKAADLGAVLFLPIPAFYFLPQTIDDIIDHSVGKVLDFFSIPHELFKRWGGHASHRPRKK